MRLLWKSAQYFMCTINNFSRNLIYFGGCLLLICYTLSLLCGLLAGHYGDYLRMRSVQQGFFDTAPALLTVCVLSAVLCDFILLHTKGKQ